MQRVGLAAFTLPFAVAFTLAASGCAHRRAIPADDAAIPDDALVLEVDNRNWSDVLIWIQHDGQRSRFLMVNAAHSMTQPIPKYFVSADGTLSLVAHRIGGGDDYYVSPKVSVRTGYTVRFTLEDDLQRSSVGVW
jgi:hypothetical protein